MKFLFLVFATLYGYEIDTSLEINLAKIASKPVYKRIDYISLKEKKKDVRIKFGFKNTTDKTLTAIVLRYSISIILEKDNSNIETVSLLSSHLRESEIKPNQVKVLYIYNIKNLLNDIDRFINAGYKPVGLKLRFMKEPKRNEEIFIKEFIFDIKEN